MGKREIELKSCPFCGQWLEMAYDCDTNDYGDFSEWYEIAGHTEYGCIMDDVLDNLGPLSLPMALDFAEAWNKRANRGASGPVESKEGKMAEELKPCPFCGGKAELCVHEPTGVSWVRCIECETSGGASSAAGATKAWNHRAERTCRMKRAAYFPFWRCSECGAVNQGIHGKEAQEQPNYCPNCGAKVVE